MAFLDINLLIFMDAYLILFLTALCVYFSLKEFSLDHAGYLHRVAEPSTEPPAFSPCLQHFFHYTIKQRVTFVRRKSTNADEEESTHIIPYIQV